MHKKAIGVESPTILRMARNIIQFDFNMILIWFNGTSALMGHFSAKMVVCKMQC